MKEMGLVIHQLWPSYEHTAAQAGLHKSVMHTEPALGGWSPKNNRFMATAYAKNDISRPAEVRPLAGGLASLGEPLEGRAYSFDPADVLAAGRLQAAWLNRRMGWRWQGASCWLGSYGLDRR